MSNPVIYIILNGELKMSSGKAAAQAVHAAMLLENNYSGSFTMSPRRTVIVLEADSAEQIKNLHEYLQHHNIFSEYYIDEGVNEVGAYSVTALAVEPIDSEDVHKRSIFASLHLFNSEKYRKWFRK